MNNNVENSVEETFDEMLDSVKSINDDFINSYFEDDKIDNILPEKEENEEFYNEESLKELSNDLTSELFETEKDVENSVENFQNSEEIQSELELEEQKEMSEDEMINLIDQTDSSEEFFKALEGTSND